MNLGISSSTRSVDSSSLGYVLTFSFLLTINVEKTLYLLSVNMMLTSYLLKGTGI